MWKEESLSLLGKLVETKFLIPVLLLLFGVVFLVMGSTEASSKIGVSVNDQLGRYILDVFGAVGVIAGIVFAYPIFFREDADQRASRNKYPGYFIDTPEPKGYLAAPYTVVGRGKPLPKDHKAYLVTISDKDEYWPQREIELGTSGAWTQDLPIGAFGKKGTIKIAVYVVGKNGEALIKHFKTAGTQIRSIDQNANVPGIVELTNDFALVAGPPRRINRTPT